jgi:hypothetical protein
MLWRGNCRGPQFCGGRKRARPAEAAQPATFPGRGRSHYLFDNLHNSALSRGSRGARPRCAGKPSNAAAPARSQCPANDNSYRYLLIRQSCRVTSRLDRAGWESRQTRAAAALTLTALALTTLALTTLALTIGRSSTQCGGCFIGVQGNGPPDILRNPDCSCPQEGSAIK